MERDFFGVFNTKKLKWEFVDIDEKIYGKFHDSQLTTVCYNQFLIISGGGMVDELRRKISIFDLNSLQLNENNLKLIGAFEIPQRYGSHGMIKIKTHLDCIKSIEYDDANSNKYDTVIDISLLLFGGWYRPFKTSFSHVTIKIGVDDNNHGYGDNINAPSSHKEKYEIIGHKFLDCEDASTQDSTTIASSGIDLLRCCVNTLKTMDVSMARPTFSFESLYYHWYGFGTFLIDNRYLVVFGGELGEPFKPIPSSPYMRVFSRQYKVTNILYFDMSKYNYDEHDYNDSKISLIIFSIISEI